MTDDDLDRPLDPDVNGPDALAHLAQAEKMQQAVRRQSQWYARYLVIFGIATIPVVTAAGFIEGPVSALTFALVWCVFVFVISMWSRRFGASRRGFARVHAIWLFTWMLCYMAVLFIGVALFPRDLAWFLPGAVVTSIPCFVTAYLEARR
jgi:hypothetical protein